MGNDDGTVWINFNGEIYNFQELRDSLEHAGYRFRSRCDTEVLLRLYEARGVECLHALGLDGRGDDGARLGAGMYFYQIRSGDDSRAGRFAIVK